MRFNIVCVGNIKEKFYTQACEEYIKRLSKFHQINIIEVEEEKLPKNFTVADIAKVQVKEGLRIEKHLKEFVVILDIYGKNFSSEELAQKIKDLASKTFTITFVIGGSYGLSKAVKEKANLTLSFSKFTFPHQLMRVILLEQLYRATTITNNIPYHK